MENDWKDNTTATPFWTDSIQGLKSPSVAVEVMFEDGKTQILSCPSCARGLFGIVKKWRKAQSKVN